MGHSVPVSLCAPFNPLEHSIRYSNATEQPASQPHTSMFPDHVIFVSKMFLRLGLHWYSYLYQLLVQVTNLAFSFPRQVGQ